MTCAPGSPQRDADRTVQRGRPGEQRARRVAVGDDIPSLAALVGRLIADPKGDVLQPTSTGYLRHGNCLTESIDDIWAKIPSPATIIENKRWLSILAN